MDSTSGMRLFSRIVEEGSFAAAARYFDLTPSSVSRRISDLEAEIGVRLFNRSTRKLSLTEAGEVYFRHATRIVADIDEALIEVSNFGANPSGTLMVSVPASFGHGHIAPLIIDFQRLYPDVRVGLSLTDTVVDLVNDGVDLALRFGELPDSSLIARRIGDTEVVICCAPSYLETIETPNTPSDLSKLNCLLYRTRPGTNTWKFKSSGSRIVDIQVSGSLFSDNIEALYMAALEGLGIVRMPSWLVNDALESGRLVPILEEFPPFPTHKAVHAVFAENRHLAPKVRVFVDFIVDRLEANKIWTVQQYAAKQET